VSAANVLTALGTLEADVYLETAHVLGVRVASEHLASVVAMLLHHPNVDYVEANRAVQVSLDTGPFPTGSNSVGIQFEFHNVLEAWEHTRGSGSIKIGILDTGVTQGEVENNGITHLGFVDDYYPGDGGCLPTYKQGNGDCFPWDDRGHGTSMVALAGAPDNSSGFVGIAPEANVYSMKVFQNCLNVHWYDHWYGKELRCDGWANPRDMLEWDDLEAALSYAIENEFHILSMSWSVVDLGASAEDLMAEAAQQGILMFSSTGNPGDPTSVDEPQRLSYVVGVRGQYPTGNPYGLANHAELLGYAGGGAPNADCDDGGKGHL
jgi:subtilisin family serine protease